MYDAKVRQKHNSIHDVLTSTQKDRENKVSGIPVHVVFT